MSAPLAVLLCPAPFTGHTSAFSAVAAELVRRGHHVRVHAPTAQAARSTAVGAEVVPWSAAPDVDDADLAASAPALAGLTGRALTLAELEHVLVGTAAAQLLDLRAAWDRRRWDVLVGDSLGWGAALAAEVTPAPWATLNPLPYLGPGRHLPPPGLGLAPGRTALGRARDAALRTVADRAPTRLQRRWDHERALARVPRRTRVGAATASPLLMLTTGVPSLELSRPDLPDQVHFVGALPPAGRRLPRPPWWPDLLAARERGRPVVHVTQGTLHTDPERLLRPALAGLATTGAFVVAITGRPGVHELPFDVPANVRTADLLPYEQLLPAVDAVVTNGGWGGVLAALAAGVPLVVAGRDADKPEVALRVRLAGVGVDLRTDHPRPAAVRAAVDAVLGEPSYRVAAAAAAHDLAGHDGPAEAADLLQTLAATGAPVLRPGPAR